MTMRLHQIGERIRDEIERLAPSVVPASAEIAAEALTPHVELRKRRAGRGRESAMMRIEEGITISPIGPKSAGGTNDREDVGYQYMVSIANGTLDDRFGDEWFVGVWEQAIRSRFNNRRVGDRDGGGLPIALSDSEMCEQSATVRTGPVPEWAQLDEGMDVVFLELTVFVRETRNV